MGYNTSKAYKMLDYKETVLSITCNFYQNKFFEKKNNKIKMLKLKVKKRR